MIRMLVNLFSRGSHTTHPVAKQIRLETDVQSRVKGLWGERLPTGLCGCPRSNTAQTFE